MKDSRISLIQFLMGILVIFAAACGDDDDGNGNNPPTTEERLAGTWTTSTSEITIMVGDKSLTDYLVEDLGWDETDAATYVAIFEGELEAGVDGSITLNSDNTYSSEFDGDPDSGTWSLSADETMLTLDDGTEAVVITVNSVTDTTLDVTIEDTLSEDLDNDPDTPDEEVEVVGEVTFTN